MSSVPETEWKSRIFYLLKITAEYSSYQKSQYHNILILSLIFIYQLKYFYKKKLSLINCWLLWDYYIGKTGTCLFFPLIYDFEIMSKFPSIFQRQPIRSLHHQHYYEVINLNIIYISNPLQLLSLMKFKLSYLSPVRDFSSWFQSLFNLIQIVFNILAFCYDKMPKIILYIFWRRPEIRDLTKEHW